MPDQDQIPELILTLKGNDSTGHFLQATIFLKHELKALKKPSEECGVCRRSGNPGEDAVAGLCCLAFMSMPTKKHPESSSSSRGEERRVCKQPYMHNYITS